MKIVRFCCFGIGVLLASHALADGCQLKNYGTLPVDMEDSRATAMVKINGTSARFQLDTGAFFNIMSHASAMSLGLRLQVLPFDVRLSGVGGSTNDVKFTRVQDFGILDTTLNNIDFIVGGSDTGLGLLGSNMLDFSDLEMDFAHGKLTLFQADHCDKQPLAYWTKGNYNVVDVLSDEHHPSDRRTFFNVIINGKSVRALLDSGASSTVLTRRGAERAGIDLNAPDVKVGVNTYGFGSRIVKTWIVPVDSFSVGTETIQHSQMQVMDGNLGDGTTEMLLGVDFLLAHHIYIANSQKKAYFTYNGGRVFTFADAPSDGDKTDGSAPLKTAADYALRGEANLSRGELKAAEADLDQAITMAPDQATYYLARARARAADKQPDAALADLNRSLTLDPKSVDALLARAALRYAQKDHAGASADISAASNLAPAASAESRFVASMYVQLEQPAAALPILDEWISVHSNDALLGAALNERCWARALSNQQLEDALSDCRKAIRRDGDNAAYLDSLGLVQVRLGQYPDAIKTYEQALAKNPKSAWSHYGLGVAKIRNGQKDAGDADLAAAHAIDPAITTRAAKYGLTAAWP